jgi:uncharacterized protein YuzE
MKLTYDPTHNIACIVFRESPEEVETIRISDELNIDMAPDGTIDGIELLNANEQVGGGKQGGNKIVLHRATEIGFEISVHPARCAPIHRDPRADLGGTPGDHDATCRRGRVFARQRPSRVVRTRGARHAPGS